MMILLGLLGLLLLAGILSLLGAVLDGVWRFFFPEKPYVPDNWQEKLAEEEAQERKLRWETLRMEARERRERDANPV